MKPIAILAGLLAAAAIFYSTGGAKMLGPPVESELPESVDVPDKTFFGQEQSNPYAQ